MKHGKVRHSFTDETFMVPKGKQIMRKFIKEIIKNKIKIKKKKKNSKIKNTNTSTNFNYKPTNKKSKQNKNKQKTLPSSGFASP